MIASNLYSEFVLLYRLLHSSRFPRDAATAHECLLERYYQQGIDEGGRVREKLRVGVEEALEILGTALLSHPDSRALRDKFAGGQMDAQKYYRQLLRLVYRLLFLMVAEERKLIFPPDADTTRQVVYTKYYSVTRLRDGAERYFAGDDNGDLWLGLQQTFRLFRDHDAAQKLGLSALDGELFGPHACEDLEGARCTNEALLSAIRHLSTFVDDGGVRRRRASGVRRRVNYAGLDVEEFGSVYESLLDYLPQVTLNPPRFQLVPGGERKQTGSYYTPPELVRELIDSALVPVMEEKLRTAKSREEKERALLDLRVCDPAAGSGHFLLAAARRIARELAKVRGGEDEPAPDEYRRALRDVMRQCVYAVDKNPLAVDLCKVALWIEGHNAGLPLSFLDHHVKCGDSLVGVFDLKVLDDGIPDEAYKPVTGDDKTAAKHYRDRNRLERRGQTAMALAGEAIEVPDELAETLRALGLREERRPEDVEQKEREYLRLRSGEEVMALKDACDLWTYAFFAPLQMPGPDNVDRVPTTDTVRRALNNRAVDAQVRAEANALSTSFPFFHWPLDFPDVFERGGFDVVLGNPPWEELQPEEVRFFRSVGAYDIANLEGVQRKRAIQRLGDIDPGLSTLWEEHKREVEAANNFIRQSGRTPLTASGKLNTYAVFAETMRALIAPSGRMGAIVPAGIATDYSTRSFFQSLMDSRTLVSLHGFDNKEGIFPAIKSSLRFCLLTVTGSSMPTRMTGQFIFFARSTHELREEHRRFTLTAEDIALLNPNTRTCPVFRSSRDADITKAAYHRVPVLEKEGSADGNPWGAEFRQGLFNMTSDSHLFRSREQLDAEGWRLQGNVFVRGSERYIPLYEAKMTNQFDHRRGTFQGRELHDLHPADKSDPSRVAVPKYWVPEAAVEQRLEGRWPHAWLLAWHRITDVNTMSRSVVAAILPRAGAADGLPLLFPYAEEWQGLLGCLTSCALDYLARQKIGGTHLDHFHLKQLPVLPPSTYQAQAPWEVQETLRNWLLPRVLELTYTAWDLQPFAEDQDYDGPPFRWDEERRFLLRCELDAAYFHLYGIERDDMDYIMETFPIVKRRDEERYGEYRTKRLILEVYDAMARAMQTGEPYRTRLDPPPADPRVAHPPRERASREVAS